MVQRSFCVLQVMPELSIWTNHIVCLLSFPFILTLESTILLSMNCILYCYVCINSAQALTRLSILCLCFTGDNPGHLVVKVRKMLPCDCHCGVQVQSNACYQSCSGETDTNIAKPTAWMLLITMLASALRRGMNS